MSFLSTLGNIGKAAVGFIPGVGPALSGALGAIGSVAGGAAQGAAEGRRADSAAMTQAQLANLVGSRDAFSAALAGQQFNSSEQDRAYRRMVLQNLLGGVQDASISRPAGSTIPTFGISGGLRPSALGDRSNLIAELGKATMTAPEYAGPKPLELPKPGLGEKILGGVGLGGSILGALGSLGKLGGNKQPPGGPYATPPYVPYQGF